MQKRGLLTGPIALAAGLVCAVALSASGSISRITSPSEVPGANLFNFNGLGFEPILANGEGTTAHPQAFNQYGVDEGFHFTNVEDGGLSIIMGGGGEDFLMDVIPDVNGKARVVIEYNVLLLGIGFAYQKGVGQTLYMEAFDKDGDSLGAEVSTPDPDATSGFFGVLSDGAGPIPDIASIVVHNGAAQFQLDDMRYGPISVPVPGAVLLGAMGLGVFAIVRRRRSR